jgi:hypothetical protein
MRLPPMPTSLFTISGRPCAGLPISCRGVGLVSWRTAANEPAPVLVCSYSIRGIVPAQKEELF